MIHVGINAIFIVPGETGGMEVYARELLPELAARDGLRVTAFVSREMEADPFGEEVAAQVVPVEARSRFARVRAEQTTLPKMVRAARCDLLHSLASTAPARPGVPQVTTIHDLNYKLVPDTHSKILGLGMGVLVPLAARASRRILVDAASTRDDLVRELKVPFGKVDVAPLGVHPPPAPPDPAGVRARLDLGDRDVVLSPSALRPHKNIARLLRAFAGLPAPRPVLVVPGYPTDHEAELKALAAELGIEADVRWPGWVPASELDALHAAATCVVFPSLYEGFGLPVLEAMGRGVPVATSSRGSLNELATGAALVFDPEDVDAIRAAVQELLSNDAERRRLTQLGLERAAQYTWARTAELTHDSYVHTLRGSA